MNSNPAFIVSLSSCSCSKASDCSLPAQTIIASACARGGEQRLLRVLVPGCFPRNPLVCNAGAHGHRLLLRVSWNAAKNRGGGFPVQAPQRSSPALRTRGPRATLPPAQTPGTHHRYVPICQDTPVTPGSSPIRPERPPVLEPHPVGTLAPGAFADVVGSALTCWIARLTTCRRSSPR